MPDQLTRYRKYYNKLKAGIDQHADYFEALADMQCEGLDLYLSLETWDSPYPTVAYVRYVARACRGAVECGLSCGIVVARTEVLRSREKIYGRLEEFAQSDIAAWNEDARSACVSFYPSLSLLNYLLEGTFELCHLYSHEKILTVLYDRGADSVTYGHALGGKIGTAFLLMRYLLEGDFKFVINAMQDCPPSELGRFRPAYPEDQLLKIAYYAALVYDGSATEADTLALQALDAGLVAYWMQEKIDHSAGYCILPDEYVVFYRAVLAILAGKNSDFDAVAAALRPRAILAQFEEVEKRIKG